MQRPEYLVMGSPGSVPQADAGSILRAMGENAGNLMFQYATTRIVGGQHVHLGAGGVAWSDGTRLAAASALIFPAANHLRTGADWHGLNAYLARPGPPLIVLGLGAQARIGASLSETITALRADPQVAQLARTLGERAALVTMRGTFSQAVGQGLGIAGAEPLGCPSAFLHPAPDLGRRVEARLTALRAALRGKGPTVRPVLAAAAPFEIRDDFRAIRLEQRLFSWIVVDRDGLYVQQSGGGVSRVAASSLWHQLAPSARAGFEAVLAPDMPPLDFWAVMSRAGYAPRSAPDWVSRLAGYDIVIGTRVHGVMAALAAGIPGVLIPHDARTAELARTMHLPMADRKAVLAADSLGAALGAVRFDGGAFDRWRRQAAARLTELLGAQGIATTPHLAGFAGGGRARAA